MKTITIKLNINEQMAIERFKYSRGCLEHNYFWMGLLAKRNIYPAFINLDTIVEAVGEDSCRVEYKESANPTIDRPTPETLRSLYLIHAGISSNFNSAELNNRDREIPNMVKAHQQVLDWGNRNNIDPHGNA